MILIPSTIMLVKLISEETSQRTEYFFFLEGVIFVHKMTCVFVGSPLATLKSKDINFLLLKDNIFKGKDASRKTKLFTKILLCIIQI